jgi:glycosyltransferase involved in cell wall biosynthesis
MYSDYTKSLKRLIAVTEGFLIKRCYFLITVNKSILNEFDKRYGYRHGFVVMNCPNYQEVVRKPREISKLKAIYLGSYQKERGLEDLIDNAHFFSDVATLYFRGWGSLEEQLRSDAEYDKENIVFLDPVPMKDIVKSLVDFDIGIIPYQPVSLNNVYSTPNKLFEYMMAGCAVISSDLPEIKKILEENKCGMTTYTDDNDCEKDIQFDDLLVHYRIKTNLYEAQQNSLRAAKEKYNWEKQVEPVIQEYQRLISYLNA